MSTVPSRTTPEGPTNDRRGERPKLWRDDYYVANHPARDRFRECMGPDYNRCPERAPGALTRFPLLNTGHRPKELACLRT